MLCFSVHFEKFAEVWGKGLVVVLGIINWGEKNEGSSLVVYCFWASAVPIPKLVCDNYHL